MERASRAIGCRVTSRKSCVEATGSVNPRAEPRRSEDLPDARRCGPVAAVKGPAGTGQSCGMRGGIVGLRPEALCGEAPKG